jgi:drug/metabolite transporter (DMT)-like permease
MGALFAELWRETTTLVHEEAELAKADLNEKVSQITTGVGSIAAGGAVLFAGLIVLLIAASNALAMVLPIELAPWLAPLIVAVVVMLIGFAMYAGGKKKLEASNLKPTRSMESLRRDGRLVKEHAQ